MWANVEREGVCTVYVETDCSYDTIGFGMAFSIRASVKRVEGGRGICFDYEGPRDEAGKVEEEGVPEVVEEETGTGACVEEEDCVGV